MTGSNVVLQPQQVLFKEGEPADGMYLVRKGKIEVFLEKNGYVVKLAEVGSGGMVGEMAFFDKKPRSASVRASAETEITKITNDDFSKLMKQIPKWFVGLMTSLSTRLRDTNERLQRIENEQAGAKGVYGDTLKILHVLNLLWHRDGTKDNKTWCLHRGKAEKDIVDIFGVDPNRVRALIQVLVNHKIIICQQDNYKNTLLGLPNRAAIDNLTTFISNFLQKNPGMTCIPDSAIEMLDILKGLVNESVYETVSIAFEDLVIEGQKHALDTTDWQRSLSYFKLLTEPLALVKMTQGLGFRVDKKSLPKLIDSYRVLSSLTKQGLT